MVTFRFYLVSLVAFFLALAVGVVVGSVLDGGIVDSLNDRLERVESNLDDTVDAIDAKNREIEDLKAYAAQSAPFAVDGRLPGTSALVVAEAGVDDAATDDLVTRLRQADSHVAGVVWAQERLQLSENGDRQRLATLLSVSPEQSPAELRAAMWRWLFEEVEVVVSDDGESVGPDDTQPVDTTAPDTTAPDATAPGSDTSETTAPTTAPPSTAPPSTAPPTTERDGGQSPALDLFGSPRLRALEDAGLVRLTRLEGEDGVGGSELVVVGITGTGSTIDPVGSIVSPLIVESAAADIPAVLSEVADGGPDDERGTVTRALREESTGVFSTVDDMDLVAGRVATVLALADLRADLQGNFGFGPDVDGIVPRWLGP